MRMLVGATEAQPLIRIPVEYRSEGARILLKNHQSLVVVSIEAGDEAGRHLLGKVVARGSLDALSRKRKRKCSTAPGARHIIQARNILEYHRGRLVVIVVIAVSTLKVQLFDRVTH